MDTQTLILLSVGVITLATMIYCIMKSSDDNKPVKTQTSSQEEEIFLDDDTSVYTVDDGAEESIFDSD